MYTDADSLQEDGRGSLRHLWRLLRKERRDLWVVVAYALLIGLLSLLTPILVQALVNTVAFGALLQPVVVMTGLLCLGLLFSGGLRGLQTYVVELLQQRLFVRMAIEIAMRLVRTQSGLLYSEQGPEQAAHFLEVATLQKTMAGLLLEGGAVFLQMGLGMVLIAFYHPLLLAFDVVLLVAVVLILALWGWKAVRTSIAESTAKYRVAAWMQELVRLPTLFRSATGEEWALEQTDARVQQYLRQRTAHFRVWFRQLLGSLALQAFASAALLGIGGALVIKRQLTLGQLVAAELVVSGLVAGVAKLAKQVEEYYDLRASLSKLGHFLDLPVETPVQTPLLESKAPVEIQWHHVSHTASPHALHNVSLRILPQYKVAILADSENLLTSLTELFLGTKTPDQGSILLHSVPLHALSETQRNSCIWRLWPPQFAQGSLLENMTLGMKQVTPTHIQEALDMTELNTTVAALPQGLHTYLNYEAEPLSPRELHRLALARAWIHRPPVLVVELDRWLAYELVPERMLDVLMSYPGTVVALTQRPQWARHCTVMYAYQQNTLVWVEHRSESMRESS